MNSKRMKIVRHPKPGAFARVESRSIAVPLRHPDAVQKPAFASGAAAKKPTQNPKLDVIRRFDSPNPTTQGSTDSQSVNKSLTPSGTSDKANQAFAKWMKEVSGSDQEPLQERLLYQATGAVTDYFGKPLQNMEYAAAAMHGIGAQDGLEGLVAAQMVGMHTLAMEFTFRAALKDQTDLGVEVNLNRAVKASEAFARLTETLSRYRGKGEQKMTVEHVHVHKGGQAIVGAVSQSNTLNNTKLKGGGDDSQ
jgi:hypothetical protein